MVALNVPPDLRGCLPHAFDVGVRIAVGQHVSQVADGRARADLHEHDEEDDPTHKLGGLHI